MDNQAENRPRVTNTRGIGNPRPCVEPLVTGGACEGTSGRGGGVDSTSRVRGPPGRPYLLVWDQTLITLRLLLVLEIVGGARRGAPMVIEWGPIARLVVLLGAWDSC